VTVSAELKPLLNLCRLLLRLLQIRVKSQKSHCFAVILSRVLVNIDGVWIG
jgi:hypothetical protein